MLWAVIAGLVILWFLGLVMEMALGGFIHLLLVAAAGVLVYVLASEEPAA
jgi:hypothetical protein